MDKVIPFNFVKLNQLPKKNVNKDYDGLMRYEYMIKVSVSKKNVNQEYDELMRYEYMIKVSVLNVMQ